MSKTLTGEAAVLRAVTDLLSAERILHWRMNAGDKFGSYKGKSWRIKGHASGTADVLAAPLGCWGLVDAEGVPSGFGNISPIFLWIECKRPDGGKQSPEQVEFQRTVEAQGHQYIIARSSDDVLAKLRELGCTSSEDNPISSPALNLGEPPFAP